MSVLFHVLQTCECLNLKNITLINADSNMQDRFVDVRMQDCYNVVKCLQDLACASKETATMFFSCWGFSNLSSLVNWPHPEMRHSRWAGVVVLKDVSHTCR